MQNKKKIIITSAIITIILILAIILILPYAIVWKSFSETNKTKELHLLNTAVNLSVLKPQKVYALESTIPVYVISKDYETAIKYIKELEDLTTLDNGIKYLTAYSYMQLKDYENALNYAKSAENKRLQTKIENKMKEKRK